MGNISNEQASAIFTQWMKNKQSEVAIAEKEQFGEQEQQQQQEVQEQQEQKEPAPTNDETE